MMIPLEQKQMFLTSIENIHRNKLNTQFQANHDSKIFDSQLVNINVGYILLTNAISGNPRPPLLNVEIGGVSDCV